jgi:hypothetical protein
MKLEKYDQLKKTYRDLKISPAEIRDMAERWEFKDGEIARDLRQIADELEQESIIQ